MKQMNAETKHWNHAINMGAFTFNLSALNNVLFTNTVNIEITLKKEELDERFDLNTNDDARFV